MGYTDLFLPFILLLLLRFHFSCFSQSIHLWVYLCSLFSLFHLTVCCCKCFIHYWYCHHWTSGQHLRYNFSVPLLKIQYYTTCSHILLLLLVLLLLLLLLLLLALLLVLRLVLLLLLLLLDYYYYYYYVFILFFFFFILFFFFFFFFFCFYYCCCYCYYQLNDNLISVHWRRCILLKFLYVWAQPFDFFLYRSMLDIFTNLLGIVVPTSEIHTFRTNLYFYDNDTCLYYNSYGTNIVLLILVSNITVFCWNFKSQTFLDAATVISLRKLFPKCSVTVLQCSLLFIN